MLSKAPFAIYHQAQVFHRRADLNSRVADCYLGHFFWLPPLVKQDRFRLLFGYRQSKFPDVSHHSRDLHLSPNYRIAHMTRGHQDHGIVGVAYYLASLFHVHPEHRVEPNVPEQGPQDGFLRYPCFDCPLFPRTVICSERDRSFCQIIVHYSSDV
ncbi:transcription accessory protein [Lasius niger]|uniref:Transcription accessory protein n=1 Tax=Lasius niger TaxID=67767 RepID=A0A0J7K5J8_LASNI|nr:transcription accessory protein [Lasius niger]